MVNRFHTRVGTGTKNTAPSHAHPLQIFAWVQAASTVLVSFSALVDGTYIQDQVMKVQLYIRLRIEQQGWGDPSKVP